MMTGSFLLAVAWTFRAHQVTATSSSSVSFVTYSKAALSSRPCERTISRLFSSSPSSPSPNTSLASQVKNCVSRLQTLQQLLAKHGAPGSQACRQPDGDLVPIVHQDMNNEENEEEVSPELLTSLVGDSKVGGEKAEHKKKKTSENDPFRNLHPYLYPIAQSQSTGHVICAYRNPSTEESDKFHPWPIVESKVGAPGMQLLSLNSEHLMRRIVAECDFNKNNSTTATDAVTAKESINLYNDGLGQGRLLKKDAALDTPYEIGAVEKLGYGVDKYVLLRIGPFLDLYQNMAHEHLQRGDEQSALIAAEAANGKLAGFACTFRFYAQLLSSLPNREEETRDAARMCLRMPLPTIGLELADYHQVAALGQITDQPELTLSKMKEMLDLMKQVEENNSSSHPRGAADGKTPAQQAIEEADTIINEAVLAGKEWGSIRPALADKFRSVGRDELAEFVE